VVPVDEEGHAEERSIRKFSASTEPRQDEVPNIAQENLEVIIYFVTFLNLSSIC